ncbi:MAG: DUF3182 family protein [Ktedonobacteraceae bacterium]|nr:DUF3182 family protein [Ktedonobacteraceae bacterium]
MKHPTVVLYGSGSKKLVSYFVQRNEAYGQWVARLLDGQFAGNFDLHASYKQPVYYIPVRTPVMSLEQAHRLGISSPAHLLGGVVPIGYLATKVITHGLIAENAHKPHGWSNTFADVVKDIVLPGFSVFSREDAIQAASHLLKGGEVRLKPALGRSGRDQAVIACLEELDYQVSHMDADELRTYGLVLERNLHDIRALSVGTLLLGDKHISYYGSQRMTINNQGSVEYGGSDLFFVKGTFEHLLQLVVPDDVRLAMTQAVTYDAAALYHYPDIIASRRNYDVGQGYDQDGNFYSGVLEQSWRIGGATGAELCAFELLQKDPTIIAVEASTYCEFGQEGKVPAQAIIQFDGIDSGYGPIKIYTMLVEAHRGSPYASGS